MKNKIKLISIILLVTLQYNAFGQLQRANKNFNLYRFSKSIPLYKKVVKNGSDEQKSEAIVYLADSYRLINNPLEAKSWYSRAVEKAGVAPINYLYLGQACCEVEDYAGGKAAFEKYAQLAPNDPRGKLYAEYCDWAMDNKNVKSEKIDIKNATPLNSKWSDFSPAPYKEGIIYTSDRVGASSTDLTYKWTDNDYLDLYVSNPKYYKDFYSEMTAPSLIGEKFQTPYHDGPIVFSKDESKVVVSRTEKKKVKEKKDNMKTHVVKLYYADLSSGKKLEFVPFYLNSDAYSCAHPTLSSDGKSMIFSSDKPGGKGESDLYMAKWDGSSWSNVVPLSDSINSVGNDVFPTLVNDTILLFASNGHPGFGGLDLFISYFKNDEWSKPKNLMKPLNSSYDDFGAMMLEDLQSGFISSNRPNGLGLDDIYAFRNFEIAKQGPETKKPTVCPMTISGLVKDKGTLKPIENATVFVYNPQTGKVKILKTDATGLYKTTIDRAADYLVKAMYPNYVADCVPWDIVTIEPCATKTAPRDLLLEKLDINKTYVLRNIYYDLDKYFIRDDAKPDLDKVIKIMRENPSVIAELSSHTDSRASFEYNNVLSQNRASAAVEYIVANGGILPGRLLARGYGEYQLTNKCKDGVYCSEEDHQLNRRTEFRIIGFSSQGTRGQFDPSKFVDGEEIDVRILPDYFFEPCDLEVKASFSANQNSTANTQTQTQSTEKKTTVTEVKSTPTSGLVKGYHIVEANETLYSLAKRYGTTVEQLREWNHIKENKIIVGQRLRVN